MRMMWDVAAEYLHDSAKEGALLNSDGTDLCYACEGLCKVHSQSVGKRLMGGYAGTTCRGFSGYSTTQFGMAGQHMEYFVFSMPS